MKSLMEEASNIFKAIENAWQRAGKPQEFSIKILEYPETGFLGLKTVKSAKVALLFSDSAKPENAPRQDQRREGYQSRSPRPDARQQRPQSSSAPRPPRQERPDYRRDSRDDRDGRDTSFSRDTRFEQRQPESRIHEPRQPEHRSIEPREPRSEPRYSEPRQSEPREQRPEARHAEPRQTEHRSSEPREQHPETRQPEPRHSEPRAEQRYTEPRQAEPRQPESRSGEFRPQEPRYSDRSIEPRYDQPRSTWTPEMVSFAQEWMLETLTLAGLPATQVKSHVSQNFLKLIVDQPVSEDPRQEEMLLRSWSNLAYEALLEKFRPVMRGLRIVIETRR